MKFSELKCGQKFNWDGGLFIRVTDSVCPHTKATINAVCLERANHLVVGETYAFSISDEVLLNEATSQIEEILDTPALIEAGRLAVENTLIDLRDSRISIFSPNGLVIKERDGESSNTIRLGIGDGLRIALQAIRRHMQ